MTAHAEEIEDEALDREKPLRMRGGLEPAHLAFPLPGRLVADFPAISTDILDFRARVLAIQGGTGRLVVSDSDT